MVMMQLLFDSLSRCFGIPLNPNDHQQGTGSNPLGSQPLGASKSRNQSNDQYYNTEEENIDANANTNYSVNRNGSNKANDNVPRRQHSDQRRRPSRGHSNLKLHDPEWDNLFESVSQRQRSSTCCYSTASANLLEEDQIQDGELEHEIDHRAQLQGFDGRYRRSSSSSSSHKDVLQKARKRSTKRKLDIFRTEHDQHKRSTSSASFASRLLGSETGFQTGAILCFANPIFDSEDDDLRLFREDKDADETINSTLYFDAKYEHIVENRPPMPLYPEQSLRLSDEYDDEIVKIFESGCLKHQIKSIYCHTRTSSETSPPPPPPQHAKPGPRSMADSSSDGEESYHRDHIHIRNNNTSSRHNAQSYKSDDGFSPSGSSPIHLPPEVTKSRQELDVISDWVLSSSMKSSEQEAQDRTQKIPPLMKLENNSSLSTQALTPTPSSSDTNLSPKKGACTYFNQASAEHLVGEI